MARTLYKRFKVGAEGVLLGLCWGGIYLNERGDVLRLDNAYGFVTGTRPGKARLFGPYFHAGSRWLLSRYYREPRTVVFAIKLDGARTWPRKSDHPHLRGHEWAGTRMTVLRPVEL